MNMMKSLSIGLLLSASLALATVADQTVYVNLSQVMQESLAGKEANAVLEKYRATKAEEINRKVKSFETAKAEMQKATSEFEAKKGLLKDVKAEEKKLTDLGRKVAKLEAELKETAEDAEKDFRAEYMKLSEQLFKDQLEAITEWAKEKKVMAVVDAESGRVLYRREGADATSDVLVAVNKKHDQKAVLAKAKTTSGTSVATSAAAPKAA